MGMLPWEKFAQTFAQTMKREGVVPFVEFRGKVLFGMRSTYGVIR